jgi:hypothetical protein
MWEKKTSTCTREITCVNDTYTWSTGDNYPDGTLYTTFLGQMNGQTFYPTSATCFAGYCDWRIPTFNELRSLLTAGQGFCMSAPCIDPIFGPTPMQHAYFSSDSVAGDPTTVWGINFTDGAVLMLNKAAFIGSARAVRGGR